MLVLGCLACGAPTRPLQQAELVYPDAVAHATLFENGAITAELRSVGARAPVASLAVEPGGVATWIDTDGVVRRLVPRVGLAGPGETPVEALPVEAYEAAMMLRALHVTPSAPTSCQNRVTGCFVAADGSSCCGYARECTQAAPVSVTYDCSL